MPDFNESEDWVKLQPGDVKVPKTFTFTKCSSATANDGGLPYGDSVSSFVATAHDEDGTDVTDDLINGTPSETDDVATVNFDYPTTNGAGIYHLKFVVVTTNGIVGLVFKFNRIEAIDE